MKTNFIIVTCAIAIIAGCNSLPGEKEAASKRNPGITPENAYNNLFLDSMAMEQFITRQELNDTLAAQLRDFYNARNYEFTWFGRDGLTEQALAFRNLYDYSKDKNEKRKNLDEWLDDLMTDSNLSVTASNARIVKTELMMTWRFINYAEDRFKDADTRTDMLLQLVPALKKKTMELADEFLREKNNTIFAVSYSLLKEELKKYVSIAQKGGWPEIPRPKEKKYSRGESDSVIVLIKKRLQATGQLTGNDTTDLFDDALENAVKEFQASYGYNADGVITPALIEKLNIPVMARIQQLLINIERMRWMPATPEGRLILVNIPEFTLHVREGKNDLFNMRIVVGKEGHNTVMFSGLLNQVVFSPYWNVPRSIVRNEILPEMAENEHYLEEHNMEITGEKDSLPVIRQLPGPTNDLGKVKFIFPNTFNIYFHDTPHKELFKKTKRDYSHGCIRLSQPVTLAEYLLKDQPEWTPEKINQAMNSGEEQYVKVSEPVPVLIYYYTAWVDHHGRLNFREDIYGHDEKIAGKLFADQQPAR